MARVAHFWYFASVFCRNPSLPIAAAGSQPLQRQAAQAALTRPPVGSHWPHPSAVLKRATPPSRTPPRQPRAPPQRVEMASLCSAMSRLSVGAAPPAARPVRAPRAAAVGAPRLAAFSGLTVSNRLGLDAASGEPHCQPSPPPQKNNESGVAAASLRSPGHNQAAVPRAMAQCAAAGKRRRGRKNGATGQTAGERVLGS